MRQKLSTSTPMRLLAISLDKADTVQSAATHSDMISPKYIISFNYYNNERAALSRPFTWAKLRRKTEIGEQFNKIRARTKYFGW